MAAAVQCSMCSNASTGRCKSCRCSPYCSRACQNADWRTHRILCKHFLKFSSPPNASARRGIFFPVHSSTPKFAWFSTNWIVDEIYGGFEKPDLKPYIGDGSSDNIPIFANIIRSRIRADQIDIRMRDTALIDGSPPNLSIAGLTEGVAFYPWYGGMLAMKMPTLDMEPGRYIHMDTVDFRDVVDLFRSYGSSIRISDIRLNRNHRGPASPLEEQLKQEAGASVSSSMADAYGKMNLGKTPTVKTVRVAGVRINCPSDSARAGGTFEAVEVASDDPVWKEPTTAISKLISLPIRVRRIKPEKEEANQAATFLHLNADPKSEFWGWVYPWAWQAPAGSVLVVHADQKPVLPMEVEASCCFCQDFLRPLFENSTEDPKNERLKEEILKHLTASSFEIFYKGFICGRSSPPQSSQTSCPIP